MKVDRCNQTEATQACSGSRFSLWIIRDETQLYPTKRSPSFLFFDKVQLNINEVLLFPQLTKIRGKNTHL